MKFTDLTEGQAEHLAALEDDASRMAYLQELNVELSDEDLEQISGGSWVRNGFR